MKKLKKYIDLQNLGLKYGTDKSTTHNYKGITYMQVYESYLRHRTTEKLNVLELGILGGSSLRAFRDYLMFSNIVGVDIDPSRKILGENRIETYVGSQDDQIIRDILVKKYSKFDVILDDASHINELSIKTFNLYWPILNDNGIYILEDISPMDGDYSDTRQVWPGQKYNKEDLVLYNKYEDLQNFYLNIIKKCQMQDSDIFSVQIYPQMIVIMKG
jgi:hypothetical protein